MTSSVIEKDGPIGEAVANRKGFIVNVAASHRLSTLVVVGIFLFMLSGCVKFPVSTLSPLEQDQISCNHPMKPSDTMIGIAMSGGGSRAALFGAAGLEALAKVQVGPPAHSLLEDISMISSVSGGSMATSYFASKKPLKNVQILTASGELSPEYQTFFKQYKHTVSQDYMYPLIWRNISRLRWFYSAWAAVSLTEHLNAQFLHELTFKDVRKRELNGEIPRLLINTTLYNNGRRLVFTTLPHEQTQYDLSKDVSQSVGAGHRSEESVELMKVQWASLQSVTPQGMNLDLCAIQLSEAVTASMSYPPRIGPITYKLEGPKGKDGHKEQKEMERYWHVGDGGLSDNTGVESLAMVALNALQQNPVHRVLIIMFDSSFPFQVGSDRLDHSPQGFTFFDDAYDRTPGIMEERALAYRTLYFRTMVDQSVGPNERHLAFLQLRHIDAVWKEDMSDLPKSCEKWNKKWIVKQEDKLTDPRKVKERLAHIATSLKFESDCDRDLVAMAAAKVVEARKGEILKFLQQSPP